MTKLPNTLLGCVTFTFNIAIQYKKIYNFEGMVNSVDKNIQVVFENKRKKSLDNEEVETKKTKIITEEITEDSISKNIVKKCSTCKKKLGFVSCYTCRCGNDFCNKHRFHDQHNCTYDYKSKAIEKLRMSNPKVSNRRIRE